jgi:hypothetical protein
VTASRPERVGRGLALAAAALLAAACQTPAAPPLGPLVERGVSFPARVPDVADYTAVELATAALASAPLSPRNDEAARALARLSAIDRVLSAAEEPRTGLVPAASDLVNAAAGDARAYRRASRALLHRGDLDPAFERRLEIAWEDDPLALADARIREARLASFGRAFNALAEPLGRSILTAALAPYRLAQSLVEYAIAVHNDEPLSLQRRQALAHWKSFVERYPDAPESRALAPRIAEAESLRLRTQRDRAVREAEQALAADRPGLALAYADRALGYFPEDRRASELREAAAARLDAERTERDRTLAAAADAEPMPPGARPLALALMRPQGDVVGPARALLADGPLADEARFALAVAAGEAGRETEMWRELEDLAGEDPGESNMARHAAGLVESGEQNPYGAFRGTRGIARRERALWIALGPWARGAPQRGLPRPLEWLVGVPSALQSIASLPLRLLQLPFAPALPSERAAEIYAERYLARHPDGERADDVREWLSAHHARRDNWLGALRVAETRADADPRELAELREKAARQALSIARREERVDVRNLMLRRVASEFPDSEAGRRAGVLAREEVLETSPQEIRLTRGFLAENPRVAGPQGLALAPQLLDGDASNGELHAEGVALVGGREIEICLVEADADAAPRRVRRTLPDPQLARLVSLVEETDFRNSLLDADDDVGADAQRDLFFERARLGLADSVDPRAAARSSYRYQGMRERYGMVRSRDSILPFELVLQGSLADLSVGAFPRIRPPRETPDAFLYR